MKQLSGVTCSKRLDFGDGVKKCEQEEAKRGWDKSSLVPRPRRSGLGQSWTLQLAVTSLRDSLALSQFSLGPRGKKERLGTRLG